MQIILSSDAAAALADPNNFRALSVVLPADVPANDLDSFVHRSGVGKLDPDRSHVHLSIESIRRLAADSASTAWDAGFDGMIAYARTKGWVDDADSTVRAHIETS